MSQPENTESKTPPSEEEVMKVIQGLLQSQYGLVKEDQEIVVRLVKYGNEKTGLTEEEKTILKNTGLMDKDDVFAIPLEFFFKGLVLPSFWMKCLLALQGMANFSPPKAVVIPK